MVLGVQRSAQRAAKLAKQRVAANAGSVAVGRGLGLVVRELDEVVVRSDERLELGLEGVGIFADVNDHGCRALFEKRDGGSGNDRVEGIAGACDRNVVHEQRRVARADGVVRRIVTRREITVGVGERDAAAAAERVLNGERMVRARVLAGEHQAKAGRAGLDDRRTYGRCRIVIDRLRQLFQCHRTGDADRVPANDEAAAAGHHRRVGVRGTCSTRPSPDCAPVR